ncbi:nicotinate-nucleotide--dimethylbenzimidazole phosphoribosyltransferase [Sneathiella marina]|uniref:Nicotinate-nucleotide--dimethylbenzimidazole phosphoribosyltransferase n=1 Tax=Sneathiella marina TaxID=2950108 RepID=A0ABY4W1L2_9PROT|nr:nicotinate-nucleotide--dimethylbenzimidazole phosphoribosyltransferase [Sneathiella marina]USG60834.1 nicotinate-nucleotide--dimethylbenzimidazole phosphoribosyltransferase [Sneathiella marina]
MPSDTLDKFRRLYSELPLIDKSSAGAAAARDAVLTKPAGALGRLEDLAVWMSGWQRKHPPTYTSPQVVVFAGNHGVCDQGISAFPRDVTMQMVSNFRNGGAAINQLADAYGASFSVLPLALETPTLDFTKGPAMSEEECCTALQAGWNSLSQDTDLLVVGEMGIGNTTVAAAISAALFGGTGADWAGPGTGLTMEGVRKKATVIDAGLSLHAEILDDPLLVLQHLGGREIAAMAGAILAARHNKTPVILDGFVVGAAAAILKKANPAALDHCVAGHMSAEPGHELLLRHLEKEPLLTLRMRLGEGSGAALALGILKGAIAAHNGMASFADAGVSGETSS